MAIALVTGQKAVADTGATSGTTIAVAFPSNVTAGNLICVQSGNDSGSASASGYADTLSNSYAAVVVSANNVSAQQRIDASYCKNISGGSCTVTATFTASTSWRHIHVSEYSGADTTAPLDKSAGNTGTSGSGSSGAQTTTTNGQLIYGGSGNGLNTAGTGFTALSSGTNYTNMSEYQIQTSAGSIDATFTGSSSSWCVIMMTFKEASGGGGGRTTKNTRSAPLGVEVGMNWRGGNL